MVNTFKNRKRNAFDASGTTQRDNFTSGNGGSDNPIAVSNASMVTSPTTRPYTIGKMAKAESISSVSEASSIFGSEQDGRCIVLREKRRHISTMYAKWATMHAKYAHYSREDIENDEEVYDKVSDIDSGLKPDLSGD